MNERTFGIIRTEGQLNYQLSPGANHKVVSPLDPAPTLHVTPPRPSTAVNSALIPHNMSHPPSK